jgi:hypothetical protein
MRILTRFAVVALGAAPAAALAADPASVSAPTLQPGDSWVYDRTHEQGANGFARQRIDLVIERVATDTLVVGIKTDGAPGAFEDHISGPDWSQRRIVDGQETVTGRPFSFPLTIGSSWTADYVDPRQHGLQTFAHFHTTYKVIGWEDVQVPAGTFHALKIEATGTVEGQMAAAAAGASASMATASGATSVSRVERAPSRAVQAITYSAFYYAPEIKYYVKSVNEQYNSDNVLTRRDTDTLVSFTAGH